MFVLNNKTWFRLFVALGAVTVGALIAVIIPFIPGPPTPFFTFTAKHGAIHAVAVDPTNRFIAAGSDDAIQVWDMQTKVLVWSKKLTGVADAVTFSSDSKILAVGISDTVDLYETRSFELVGALQCLSQVNCMAMANNKPLLCVGCLRGFELWDLASNKLLDQRSPNGSGVQSVEFSGDDNFVVVSTYSDGPAIYDIASRTVVSEKSMANLSGPATFGPKPHEVVVGDAKERALIFVDAKGDVEVKRLECDIGWIEMVKQSSNAKHIVATGGVDNMFRHPVGRIKVWRTVDDICVLDASSQGRRVRGAAFCVGGTCLVTGNQEGQVEFWEIK
jgi:WD40 repeat protein